ncbi:MAG TPA: flagellar basal body rod protein FlgB [Sulfuricurvum sp.]|nr:flagellar basal body rod protein FlgB [Sulfuricurvum sp.]
MFFALVFQTDLEKGGKAMGLTISRSHDLMKSALDYRAARQDIIAGNIANADTPFYRPKDISFEDTLAQKSAEIFRDKSQTLQMAHTNGAHLGPVDSGSTKATTFFRDGHMARNDGNSVDLDVETTEMAKNSTMFNALTAALKKDSNLFKSVIDASSKTS